MEMRDPILFAYEITKEGEGLHIAGKTLTHKLKATDLAWVHLDASMPEAQDWLNEHVPYLDQHLLSALFAEETRPRFLEHENGILIILRGVNLNENADPEDMISTRIWIDDHRIISAQLRPLKAIRDIRDKLEQGKGPKNAGEFLATVCAQLLERMQPTLIELDDRTDGIEEHILDEPSINYRHEIIDIRKKAIIMRRYIAPQKDVLSQLKMLDLKWISKQDKRHLNESFDRITRYVEDLDAIRERAQIVKDELANIMADRMNNNMYVLSVVAAIFLPLGFFTGLLGINVGGMPGADNEIAFWIVCGMCVGVSVFLLGLFKWLKWV